MSIQFYLRERDNGVQPDRTAHAKKRQERNDAYVMGNMKFKTQLYILLQTNGYYKLTACRERPVVGF